MKGWLKRKGAAVYADVSLQTIDAWLKDGLDSVKPTKGPKLIRISWIDRYLEGFRTSNEKDQINEIVEKTLEEFRS